MPRPRANVVDELLTHNVVEVIDRANLRARLLRGEKLRVKLGIDPTAPDIHFGLAVVLRKLREFQDCGHTAVLIIGDSTARIGDPSGRTKTRPVLHRDQITANKKTYLRQIGRIVDLSRTKIYNNSKWFSRLSFADMISLLQKFTVARILERDDFQKRLHAQSPISLHELLYPVLQAFDSVAVKADIEIGGTDQTFNLLAGRDLQPHFQQPPQDILTVPLLVGLDGKEKMSKSLGNSVGITESSDDMIGKLMTIPDMVISDYARLAADWPEAKVDALSKRMKKKNPRDVKLIIARDVVALYHGAAKAKQAASEWLRVFHKKELPRKIPAKTLRVGSWDTADLLVAAGLVASKGEAKRVLAQGGVRQNELRVEPSARNLTITKGDLLQVGKRNIVRVS